MAKDVKMKVELGAEIRKFQKKMKEALGSVKELGKGMEEYGKDIGVSMGIAGGAVAAGLGFAVSKAMDFESSMNRVKAISGVTGEQFAELEKTAMELGATTSFSATQASEGMSFLAMAGFEANEIVAAMPGLLDTAAAGQMKLGETADIVSNILSGFGMEASQTGEIADILSKTFTTSNTDLRMLGETMKYAAPIAAAMGVNLKEAATAAAFMGDAGIQGSMAGTALAGGLSRLANPVGAAKEAMEKMGWTAIDAEGNFKSLQQIVAELTNKTKDMTQAEKAATLTKLFGMEAAKGWLAVIARGPEEFAKYEAALGNAGGTAQRVADTQMDGLKGALDELSGAFESAMISIGNAFLPTLEKLTDKLTGVVDMFNGLSDPMKRNIALFAAVGAGILLLFSALGFLMMGIGALITASWAVILPIVAIVAVIGVLIAAFIWAYNKFDWFREGVQAVFSRVKAVVMMVIGAVVGFIKEKLKQITTFWQENGKMILQAVKNVWGFIAPIIKVAMAIVVMIIQGTWNAIKGLITAAINIILGIIKFFAALFTGNWKALWEATKQILFGALAFVWNLFLLTFGRVFKFIGKILGKILSKIGGWGSKAITWFKNIATKIGEWIMKGVNAVKKWFSNMVTTVSKKIGKWKTDMGIMFLNIVEKAKTVFAKIVDVITDPFKDAWKIAKGIIDKIKNVFNNLKLKIPKPKLPRISVDFNTKSFMGMSIPIPDFDLSWYKTGGMFNGPSMIGVGEQPGVKEVAMPLSGKHMQPFAEAVAQNMPGNGNGGEYTFNSVIEIDGREFARAQVKYDQEELERRKEYNRRARGKQVIR